MKDIQRTFIDYCLKLDVLKFGEFTLKSGRLSPYFFNAGLFNTGTALAELGRFYAATIEDANINYDMLFGPAYKGIPLVTTTAIALSEKYNKDLPFCFNRKEAKKHGEGGNLVGTKPFGKVLLVDDVMTAGTALGESIPLIENAGAKLSGVIIALNRQEKKLGKDSTSELTTIEEIEQAYGIPVVSIITLKDLINYLQEQKEHDEIIKAMLAYQADYGVLKR